MKGKTDHQLMRQIHRKHRPALEELYDRYANLIYSFALKTTKGNHEAAKDIVQLVFLRLWSTHSRFDPKKGELANWLITITRNISIDYIRKESLYRRHSDAYESANPLPDQKAADVLQLVAERYEARQIRHAQSQLTELQRRLITRLYWEGYTLKEIAELEKEPIGTVKNRLHQALKKLHHLLADGKGGLKDGSKNMR
ncbi:MAG TPA: sigma-70 family RNA polymerase sigma factor [Bacillales bacterium]|nr:sigma-70 family RNA polymerase sigma factor [Bacillales bacterium]